MSFRLLYQQDDGAPPDLFSLGIYINSFAKGIGLKELNIDAIGFNSVANALTHKDFPHCDGIRKASPFKKAAHFFVWFIASKPIIGHFPELSGLEAIRKVENYQNVIMAYMIVVDCLHRAELFRKDRKEDDPFILENRIAISKHFLCDLVEAYSTVVPATHFQTAALLFEQMAYKANPQASYPEIF